MASTKFKELRTVYVYNSVLVCCVQVGCRGIAITSHFVCCAYMCTLMIKHTPIFPDLAIASLSFLQLFISFLDGIEIGVVYYITELGFAVFVIWLELLSVSQVIV